MLAAHLPAFNRHGRRRSGACGTTDRSARRRSAADGGRPETVAGLSPNQQTLWNKAEGASRTILRDRARRRAALQEWARTLLASPDADLRKLDAATEAESATANAEDRQLRGLWLDVNDGLDDDQRRRVAGRLGEQLLRVVPEGGQRSSAPAGPRDEQNRRGGPGNGRGPGAGLGPGGPGGASLNFGG